MHQKPQQTLRRKGLWALPTPGRGMIPLHFVNNLSRSRRCGFLRAENERDSGLSFLPVTGEARKPSLYFCFVNSIKILDTRFNSLYTTNLKMKTIFIR